LKGGAARCMHRWLQDECQRGEIANFKRRNRELVPEHRRKCRVTKRRWELALRIPLLRTLRMSLYNYTVRFQAALSTATSNAEPLIFGSSHPTAVTSANNSTVRSHAALSTATSIAEPLIFSSSPPTEDASANNSNPFVGVDFAGAAKRPAAYKSKRTRLEN
jgi:hypothetical protein